MELSPRELLIIEMGLWRSINFYNDHLDAVPNAMDKMHEAARLLNKIWSK